MDENDGGEKPSPVIDPRDDSNEQDVAVGANGPGSLNHQNKNEKATGEETKTPVQDELTPLLNVAAAKPNQVDHSTEQMGEADEGGLVGNEAMSQSNLEMEEAEKKGTSAKNMTQQEPSLLDNHTDDDAKRDQPRNGFAASNDSLTLIYTGQETEEYDPTQFKKVIIDSSVDIIDCHTFSNWSSLEVVDFERGKQPNLRRIMAGAFQSCAKLFKVSIPNGVVSIGAYAFNGCVALERIVLPPSVTSLGDRAFCCCTNLKEIAMRPHGISIGFWAMSGCRKLGVVSSTVSAADAAVASNRTMMYCRRVSLKEKHRRNKYVIDNRLDGSMDPIPVQGLVKKIIADSNGFTELVASLFEAKLVNLQWLNQQELNAIVDRTLQSARMQRALKDMSVERRPVFLLMLEGYMNIALLALFVFASDRFLTSSEGQQPSRSVISAIYCIAVYFMCREAIQLRFEMSRYFENIWNGIDVTRVILVLASVGSMQATQGGDELLDSVRYLLLVTGAFVIGGMILFLRSTFLPFAEFVGGIISIFRDLLPFLVVSTLMVFAFAFMYFTIGFDKGDTCEEVGLCSLSDSMLTSLSFFFAGPDSTDTWWLDVLFGFVVVIILLNVVIAIVSDAWEESTARAGDLFRTYRIEFLAEVYTLEWLCCPSYKSMESFFTKLDVIGNCSFRDNVNWDAFPYNVAKDDYVKYRAYTAYKDGEGVMGLTFHDYEKLRRMGSFERDWYWATQPAESFPEGVVPASKMIVIGHVVWHVVALFLGVVTCGLLWPFRIREDIFGSMVVAAVMEEEEEVKNNNNEEEQLAVMVGAVEEKMDQMETRFEMMESRYTNVEARMEKMETKLDIILGLLEKKL